MKKQSTSEISNCSTMELIMISARAREILRCTGIENTVAAILRLCPTYELRYNPVIWAIYSRGWLDWTADITHIYNAPNLTSLTTNTILQPIKGSECITYRNQTPILPERYPGELVELRQRGIQIIESQGGVLNAMDRIAVVVSSFSVARIRSDPILWAVYTRAWKDRADLEDSEDSE